MEEIFDALNQLVAEGVLAAYAIGGAIAASFYIEALRTEDVDAFVYLPNSGSGLVLLDAVYSALVSRGGSVEGGHVRFGAWPLQILTDANALLREAIDQAVDVPFGRVNVRVFRADHLLAIALQTGREKDYLRAAMLLEEGAVRKDSVMPLLEKYGLLDRWAQLKRRAALRDRDDR